MKIRNKILIYFSSTVIVLTAISLAILYILFSEYREEEFQQLQNEKIKYTIGLVTEFQEMSEEVAFLLDAQDIHDFYDEKLLIYNSKKELVFSSLDSLPIQRTGEILNELSPSKQWIETKEDDYDLIGVYIENKDQAYYAISKAYDAVGYSKLYFLRNVIIAIFGAITVVVILVSVYLSNIISKPITRLSENLKTYDLTNQIAPPLKPDTTSAELKNLTQRFNDLLYRTKEAFAFQKNAINHISHELKTPVAILVSELEKTAKQSQIEEIKTNLDNQISLAKSLGEIIHVFLEISKIESGQELEKSPVRIDEVLFDIVEELNILHPEFYFDLNYFPKNITEEKLIVPIHKQLIKQAFQNLLINCITYGDNPRAEIIINGANPNELIVSVSNTGPVVGKEEQKKLFKHSFRGSNSEGKVGFGLGLVLTKRIIDFYKGEINYRSEKENRNTFEVRLKQKPPRSQTAYIEPVLHESL